MNVPLNWNCQSLSKITQKQSYTEPKVQINVVALHTCIPSKHSQDLNKLNKFNIHVPNKSVHLRPHVPLTDLDFIDILSIIELLIEWKQAGFSAMPTLPVSVASFSLNWCCRANIPFANKSNIYKLMACYPVHVFYFWYIWMMLQQ